MLVSPAGFTMLFISMLERGTPCPRYAFMFLVIRISSRVVHPLLLVAKVFPCSPIAPIHYRQPDSSPSVEGRPGNCMQILIDNDAFHEITQQRSNSVSHYDLPSHLHNPSPILSVEIVEERKRGKKKKDRERYRYI